MIFISSRKFIDEYEYGAFGKRYNNVKAFIKALIMQLEYEIAYDNDNKWLSEKLNELNNLKTILKDYLEYDGKYCIYDINSEMISYMAKKYPDGRCPREEVIEFYENSELYSRFKNYLKEVFDIEDEIHKKYTLELWKSYCTPVESNFNQGDNFRYIVHSGYGIIKLPGLPNYTKTRNIYGDFVSASLLSNEQMHMYNGNVGLILEPNESIIASSIADSGTRIDTEQGMNSILDFGNGTFVNTSLDPGDKGIKYIPTKIQSPQHLHKKFMKELERRNLDPLAEGWPVNEVILDDRKIKVIGVFFRVNENQLLLSDFVRAHNMSVMYKVPLRIVNVDKYKKQGKIEKESYENLRIMLKENIENNYDLIRLYLNEVGFAGEFCNDVMNIFREELGRYEKSNLQKKGDDDLER